MSGAKRSAAAAAALCAELHLPGSRWARCCSRRRHARISRLRWIRCRLAKDGRQIYEHICQGFHMADGGGAVGAGRYPALRQGSDLGFAPIHGTDAIDGQARKNTPQPVTLNDAQIAAVTYVRTNFGNHYTDSMTAAEVAALDAKDLADLQGRHRAPRQSTNCGPVERLAALSE